MTLIQIEKNIKKLISELNRDSFVFKLKKMDKANL